MDEKRRDHRVDWPLGFVAEGSYSKSQWANDRKNTCPPSSKWVSDLNQGRSKAAKESKGLRFYHKLWPRREELLISSDVPVATRLWEYLTSDSLPMLNCLFVVNIDIELLK